MGAAAFEVARLAKTHDFNLSCVVHDFTTYLTLPRLLEN